MLFRINQCFDQLMGEVGPPKRILVSGGIVNSQRWIQMLADLLGMEI